MNTEKMKFKKNPSPKNIDFTLREIYENEDTFFPVRFHHTSHEPYRKQLIHRHWHQEMEILLVIKGTIELSIEDRIFLVSANDLVIIPSKFIHSATNAYNIHCEFYAIVFNLDFLSSHKPDLIHQLYICPLIDSSEEFLYVIRKSHALNEKFRKPIYQMLEQYGTMSKGYELGIKAYLYIFLNFLYTHQVELVNYPMPSFNNTQTHSHICKKIISFIEENFNHKMTLEEISLYVGFEYSYFCRFFKKHFKMSFITYLNLYRVRNAEYYLLHSEKKIIDIAIESGFDDATYFASVFKKITGYTPSNYRKEKKLDNI